MSKTAVKSPAAAKGARKAQPARRDPLLQPYRLKHLTLKNRIMTTAHEPAYPEDGLPKDRYRAYHEERAKGGVALTMTAGSAAVSKDSPPVFNNILAYKDEVVPWMKRLADACHAHGAAVMIQLTHLGRRTRSDKGDWLPAISAGLRREPAHRGFPKKAEDWDVERIVSDYADAAERMKAADLDGIELECYGHLLDQFVSPLTNEMDPPYGGALDNRLRFLFDVLGAIRARVGPDFLVGVRYTADETRPGGLQEAEGLEMARRMRDSGLVDFLNVIRGRIASDAEMTRVIPVQGMKSAPHLDFAGRVRAESGMPTFHAARIPDVATARHAVAAGLLDMVGMTRAHMADPHIVMKIREGREDDIRPCVGANHCLDRIYQAGDALCIHNAASGRELSTPHVVKKARKKRRVVVVGAGPAGLEAARVAAERGHEATVLEAAAEPGGQLRLAAETRRRREMLSIVDWRMSQCAARDVAFHFNQYAEAEDVTALAPDVAIVATGGYPDTDLVASGGDLVVSAWDVLSGDAKLAENALIYDEAGDYPGLHAAEKAAEAGVKIEVVTPDRTVFPEVMAMSLTPAMEIFLRRGVAMTLGWRIERVEREGNQLKAVFGSDFGDVRMERVVDQVIVNYGTRPLDELYFALKPLASNLGAVDYEALIAGRPQRLKRNKDGVFQLFRIGDAVTSRGVHAAIYDGLRFAKDL